MYADDVIILAKTKSDLQTQLDKIGEYGVDHAIKFNPTKCELIVFNNLYKRTKAMSIGDEWQGEIILNGKIINQVSTIKYLGIMISDDYSNKCHISKRKQASFSMLAKISKPGFNDGNVGPQLIGNMFRTYIRPVALYGIEILEINKTEIESLKKLESNILKKMIGFKQRNYSRHLFNAMKIGHTKRFIKKMKLQFYIKLN